MIRSRTPDLCTCHNITEFMAPYNTLEHSTDALIEVVSPSIAEAFQDAGYATIDIMINREHVKKSYSRTIHVEADSMHELLFLWLEEMIFQTITDGFAISEICVTYRDGHIDSTVHGEPLDIRKHHFRVEVKAPTYHEMAIQYDSDATMRFLLDL